MNKKLKKAIGFYLLLLYGFATSIYSGDAFFSDPATSDTYPVQTERYYARVVKSLPCHTAQGEGAEKVVSNLSPTSAKVPFSEFATILRSAQQLISFKYFQYHFFSKNILIRLRQTDIIFPFHYFW